MSVLSPSNLSPLAPARSPLDSSDDSDNAGDSVTSIMKRIGDRQKAVTAVADKTAGDLDKISAKSGALVPPKLTALPPDPQAQSRSPVQAFGSFAGNLAILGGLLTRRPLVASLKAATGVMNAYKAQDNAAANYQFNLWKVNTENALKLQDFKLESYRDAIERAGNDQRAVLAAATTTLRALGDNTAADIGEMHGLTALNDHMIEEERLAREIDLAKPKIEDLKQRHDLWQQVQASDEYKNATPMGKVRLYNETWGEHGSAQLQSLGLGTGTPKDVAAARGAYATEFPVSPTSSTAVRIDSRTGKAAPPFDEWYRDDWKKLFAPGGESGSNGPEAPGAKPAGKTLSPEGKSAADVAAILQKARDAIAKGAPREAVIDRLKSMGVDPGSL